MKKLIVIALLTVGSVGLQAMDGAPKEVIKNGSNSTPSQAASSSFAVSLAVQDSDVIDSSDEDEEPEDIAELIHKACSVPKKRYGHPKAAGLQTRKLKK